MLERLNPLLRIVCLVLGGLILFQISKLVNRREVFARGGIESSTLPPDAKPAATNAPSNRPGAAPLPAHVQTQIDQIKRSQLLGPDIKPPPMALLGIAGADVFLRAPSGQTGVIREGEELGGVKLLRVGTNRVIVEHEKQQKELTIFSGFGSDSLLPQKKEKSEAPR